MAASDFATKMLRVRSFLYNSMQSIIAF